MRIFKPAAIAFLIFAAAALFFMHRGVRESTYISSVKCKACHERYYEAWRANTLHPRIFRPLTSEDEIAGNFSAPDPAVTFARKDIEYIVGNKWEQVYARKIKGEFYQLPAKWMMISKKWEPVPDWKETPMSRKCNGCHTTGFNPSTLEFKEFGIGCEACHGPGSTHVGNRRKKASYVCSICHRSDESRVDIIKSVNSSVCGQCHNRGTSMPSSETGGTFNFPVSYSPGEDINKHFKQMDIKSDKKNEYWWGNGISKNRHQEFSDWQNSKHSKALKLLEEKYTKDRGEKTDSCLNCHSADYRFAKPAEKPGLNSAKYGVTCVSCHDPHGMDKRFAFAVDGTSKCGGCHVDSMSFKTSKKRAAHYPCPPAKVSCADCHMPYIVKSGGAFSIRSHAFKIIRPEDTVNFGVPNSCQNGGCHSDRSIEWAKAEFSRFYPGRLQQERTER